MPGRARGATYKGRQVPAMRLDLAPQTGPDGRRQRLPWETRTHGEEETRASFLPRGAQVHPGFGSTVTLLRRAGSNRQETNRGAQPHPLRSAGAEVGQQSTLSRGNMDEPLDNGATTAPLADRELVARRLGRQRCARLRW